jgi:hypothetical protein
MKNENNQSKKIILPLILSVSISINLLYFFNILNFKFPLLPSKGQTIKNQEVHQFIDSPLDTFRVKDSIRIDRK